MNSSLIFGIICLLGALITAKADMNDLIDTIKVCHETYPTSTTEVEKFVYDKTAEFGQVFKCHVKCVLEKESAFKNGKFDDQAFIKFSQEIPSLKNRHADVVKAAEECKNQNGTNECETAYKTAKCLMNHDVVMFLETSKKA
ncbi:general odorant-binding protein 56h-like [Musca autumnalis]|uniref:general odorant-binding protein 56h-like n=1 Tax=Musca autumnalis TaxID=221902 RepID=UPI003CED7DB5